MDTDDTLLYALGVGCLCLSVICITCLCICCCGRCPQIRIIGEINEEDNEEVETGENCEEVPHSYGHPHPPDQVWSIGLEYGIESQGNRDLDNLAPPSYNEAVQS